MPGRAQFRAPDFGASQQIAQQRQRNGVEIRGVFLQRHGQHGLDAHAEIEHGLRHEQIGAFRHTDHHAQFSVRQVLADFLHEDPDRVAQARQIRRIQIAVT